MIFYNKKEPLFAQIVQLSFGEITGVVLGEMGRGRRRLIIPIRFRPIEIGKALDLKEHSIEMSISHRPEIIKKREDKLFLIINTYGGYTRRGSGWIRPIEGDFKILAEGNGADGEAGRIGTWGVYVIEAPQNGVLRIRYSGQYRNGVDLEYNDLLFIEDGKPNLVELKDIENYCDTKGISLPPFLKYNSVGDIEFV